MKGPFRTGEHAAGHWCAWRMELWRYQFQPHAQGLALASFHPLNIISKPPRARSSVVTGLAVAFMQGMLTPTNSHHPTHQLITGLAVPIRQASCTPGQLWGGCQHEHPYGRSQRPARCRHCSRRSIRHHPRGFNRQGRAHGASYCPAQAACTGSTRSC